MPTCSAPAPGNRKATSGGRLPATCVKTRAGSRRARQAAPEAGSAHTTARRCAKGTLPRCRVNATSASLQDTIPPIPPGVLSPTTLCYDMAYGKGDTAFTRWAKSAGAGRAETGWGMLVEQAAESFLLWRGVKPDTAPVIAAVKSGTRP